MQINDSSLKAAADATFEDTIPARRCPTCGHVKVDPEYRGCEGPHAGPFATDRSHKYAITEEIVLLPVSELGAAVGEYLEAEGLKTEYKSCESCHGSGEFDHGAGEGRVAKCIPMDPNNHRYCPCEFCGGTGRVGLERLVGSWRETPKPPPPSIDLPDAPEPTAF